MSCKGKPGHPRTHTHTHAPQTIPDEEVVHRDSRATSHTLIFQTTIPWGSISEGFPWHLRKNDFIHHHHPEGVVYRCFCLNSSTFAVSEIVSRRWWCIESPFPHLGSHIPWTSAWDIYREKTAIYTNYIMIIIITTTMIIITTIIILIIIAIYIYIYIYIYIHRLGPWVGAPQTWEWPKRCYIDSNVDINDYY